MNVKINSVKFKADRKLEDFINERIGKLTTYYDGLISSEVTLKIDAYHVTVLDNKMQPVVRHKRLYGKNKESMIWGPYLDVLAQRPMALKYSGFFKSLPDPVRYFLDDCDLEGKKQVLTEKF